jgi:hypothetical protein
VVGLADGSRAVRARAATGAERDRLWGRVGEFPGWGDDVDTLAARRPAETAVVVFEPRSEEGYGLVHTPDVSGIEQDEPADAAPTAARAARTEGGRRRGVRLRHLWLVPGLGIAFFANWQAQQLGLGILPLLAFGIAPDLPRLLGVGQPHAHGQMAARAVPAFNLMHHPASPIAVLALAAAGVVPPVLYVGALAWLGHIVLGLAIGDRVRRADGWLRPLWPGNRPVGRSVAPDRVETSSSAERAA